MMLSASLLLGPSPSPSPSTHQVTVLQTHEFSQTHVFVDTIIVPKDTVAIGSCLEKRQRQPPLASQSQPARMILDSPQLSIWRLQRRISQLVWFSMALLMSDSGSGTKEKADHRVRRRRFWVQRNRQNPQTRCVLLCTLIPQLIIHIHSKHHRHCQYAAK